ncbi:MAG: ABC transporter ATP-binding protein [Candidatus Hydrogenedentota bacterium]
MGITVDHIAKSIRGQEILRDISFDVADGDFATILGATGSGKTSLLRIIAGIDRPDAGRILFDGEDVTAWPVQRRNVAFVYQQFVNYPSLTVFENIASPLRVSKASLSKEELTRRVDETAELLGLSAILHHRPEEISGGQQQRCAIARALVKGSKYIFLDEPLANLDYKLREELRGELKRIFRDRGGCAIYATPEPVDALSMATHVGYMQDGQLVQYGPTQEVYKRPAHRDVGAYFSYPEMNILSCIACEENDALWIKVSDSFRIPWPWDRDDYRPGEYLVGIRAHELRPTLESENTHLRGTVELAEVVGSDTELHLKHESHSLLALLPSLKTFSIGDSISLTLSPEKCFLFDATTGELKHVPASDAVGV